MATYEQLATALRNADAAGDVEAARALAQALASMRPPEPVAVKAGGALKDIPRQIGLTARYGLEGLGQAAEIVTEPVRQLVTDPLAKLVTGRQPSSQRMGQVASGFADALGLPQPADANERVIADASRLVAGAGGLSGAARGGAAVSSGLMKEGLAALAASPAQQALSAGGAGLASGSVREAGGDPAAQAVAGLVGGLAAPGAVAAIDKTARNVRSWLPQQKVQVNQRIDLMMRNAGVDWANVSTRVKQAVQADLAEALKTGRDLDPAAVRRLVDFRQVQGATPTRGMLTLDPVQITREQNLAKTAANSSDIGLQRLPRIQNDNNAALINALNAQGAKNAPDAYATGQQVIGALDSRIGRSKATIDALYERARDNAGRSAPLDGAAFTTRASQILDDAMLGGALPAGVQTHLNKIAKGEVPFTVDYAEQLKTQMGKLQRATNDGQTRYALGLVRQALDDTPVSGLAGGMPARPVNPGGLPGVPGDTTLGEGAIKAFNRARTANRAFMGRVEATPALKAVLDGVEPDQFVQKFIIGQGATVKDVDALRKAIATPGGQQALAAVKSHIVDYLKRQATGGAADDVAKFSQAGYNRALQQIGERKLAAFFSPDEIEQLKAVGRVASYMQVQPVGAAVNNSNSGALVIGRAMDMLDRVASKLPLGVDTTIQGLLRGVQQSQAMNVQPSLLMPAATLPLRERVGYPLLWGGLLASQPAEGRQDR